MIKQPKNIIKRNNYGSRIYEACILIFALMISGCHNSREILFDGVGSVRNYASWRQDFKDQVLCNCVLKGVGNKYVTDTIRSVDKTFNNEIAIIFKKDINDALIPVISKMKADSLQSITTVAEGAAGKYVFDSCIKFYKSNKLDSISKAKLAKWKKMNIDSVRAKLLNAY